MKEELGDYDLLKARFDDLSTKHRQACLDSQKLADWGQTEISNSKFVIDQLRSELRSLQEEYQESETSQIRIIDTILILGKDVS